MKRKPSKCPYCGSKNLGVASAADFDGWMWGDFICFACCRSILNKYELEGTTNNPEPRGEEPR